MTEASAFPPPPPGALTDVPSEKSWLVTTILSALLGALGVDRFYLGHTKLAVFKLITCGGCGVWALVDLIIILTGSMKDANGRKVKWNSSKELGIGAVVAAIVLLVGGIVGATQAGSASDSADVASEPPSTATSPSAQAPAAKPSKTPKPTPTKPAEPSLTNAQENAVRSAENYLSFAPFSRDGLIRQLSSKAGDGYDKQDATVAVDSLKVDWKEQAVKAAENYLSMTGFSCQNLIQQLSSSAGDMYTKAQAQYGAQQAGAC